MKLFGHRKYWWLTQFAKFQYRIGRGDSLQQMVFGKIRAITYAIITMGTGTIVVEGWFNINILDYVPWWVVIIVLPIVATALDYFFGWLDEKHINLMQIQAEIIPRRGLDPWQAEIMNRLKSIEKKVNPKKYKERHKTYMDEERIDKQIKESK